MAVSPEWEYIISAILSVFSRIAIVNLSARSFFIPRGRDLFDVSCLLHLKTMLIVYLLRIAVWRASGIAQELFCAALLSLDLIPLTPYL